MKQRRKISKTNIQSGGVGGMIDVGGKDVTVRTAEAQGRIVLGEEAFDVLKQRGCRKGNVLETAKVAAIQAVKSTPTLIPMCHPILVEAVEVDFDFDEQEKSVIASVTVRSTGKTGVEMEAMCGAAAACLTIYDMLKYVSRAMTIGGVKLIEKTGGKSGEYKSGK